MSLATRGSSAAARTLRISCPLQSSRRYASSHGAGHGHGHGESALHLKDANTTGNESFGKGFYYTLGTIPLFYIVYAVANGTEDNFFARQYQSLKEGGKRTTEAENLHTAALSQAIHDRARVSSYPREVGVRDLSYPEMFNGGSPWNLAVGQDSASLKDVAEHYKKTNAQAEQERISRQKDGRPSSLYE